MNCRKTALQHSVPVQGEICWDGFSNEYLRLLFCS